MAYFYHSQDQCRQQHQHGEHQFPAPCLPAPPCLPAHCSRILLSCLHEGLLFLVALSLRQARATDIPSQDYLQKPEKLLLFEGFLSCLSAQTVSNSMSNRIWLCSPDTRRRGV